jgi:hypothetical protein
MGNLVTALDQRDKKKFIACTMSVTRLHRDTIGCLCSSAWYSHAGLTGILACVRIATRGVDGKLVVEYLQESGPFCFCAS